MSLCVAIYSKFQNELQLDRFTNVKDLSQALERLFARPSGRFAIDLAFDPLPTDAVREFLERAECRACLSERAVPLLSESIAPDTTDAGTICGIKFYAGFPISKLRGARLTSGSERATGWLAGLSGADRQLTRQLAAAGIVDERSYQATEHLLTQHLRVAAARARYLQLAGAPPEPAKILDNLTSCPPWVIGARLKDLALPARTTNVLRAHSLSTVGELSRFGTSGLLKLPNLGLKSLRELGEIVYELMLREPAGGAPVTSPPLERAAVIALPHADSSFIELLRDELSSYAGLAEAVLLERWGLIGERRTLQQLAEVLGVTRERVRQIEVQAAERLRGASVWVTFAQHIDGLLGSREMPLWLDRFPAEDPWFGGSPLLPHGLATCVDLFLGPRFHLLTIKGRLAVSALSAAEWSRIIEDCQLILGTESPHDNDRVSRLAAAVLVEKGSELRDELVRHLIGPSAEDGQVAEVCPFDPDVALSRQLERALLERTLLRATGS